MVQICCRESSFKRLVKLDLATLFVNAVDIVLHLSLIQRIEVRFSWCSYPRNTHHKALSTVVGSTL